MSGIGFLADVRAEKKVDPAEFALAFAEGKVEEKDAVIAGFKSLIDSRLIFVLDNNFKAAASVLVNKGLIDMPLSMEALVGKN